jgi:hypothetical protein
MQWSPPLCMRLGGSRGLMWCGVRVFLALLVGVALGFAAGFLAFESPIGDRTTDVADVEDRLLRAERRAGTTADFATCRARQAGDGREFLCEVLYGISGGTVDDVRTFSATVSESGAVAFTPRGP